MGPYILAHDAKKASTGTPEYHYDGIMLESDTQNQAAPWGFKLPSTARRVRRDILAMPAFGPATSCIGTTEARRRWAGVMLSTQNRMALFTSSRSNTVKMQVAFDSRAPPDPQNRVTFVPPKLPSLI